MIMHNSSFDEYVRSSAYYSEAPKAPTPTPSQPQKVRKCASGRDMVFVFICLAVSIFSVDFLFWAGAGIGVSVMAAAFLTVSLVYLSKKGMKLSAYTVILSLLYVTLSASLTFSDGGFSKFLAICMLLVIYSVILVDTMGLRRYSAGTYGSIGDIFYALFALTFGSIGRTGYGVFHKKNGELTVNRKTGSIFIGFAFAIPVLCIIVPLLSSSDAAFEGLLRKFTFDKMGEIIGAVILGACFFILWFGQLFSAEDQKREKHERKAERGGIEPAVLTSFLAVISLAYVLYLFSQTAYFFDGFSGLLPEGFTMAEYARRGFFEMVAICAINLVIIFVTTLICKRKDGRASISVRSVSAFLSVFSILLSATSLSKLVLYINSYGMTHLRIYTSLFCLFLAVVFIAVLIRLFAKNLPYMKAALICGAVIVSVMCFADVDGVIAKYNVEAYLDGRLETVDVYALSNLSSDAVVPYVFELIDDDNQKIRDGAREILSDFCEDTFEIEHDPEPHTFKLIVDDYDFRRFNIREYKARKMLIEDFDEYYGYNSHYDHLEPEREAAK